MGWGGGGGDSLAFSGGEAGEREMGVGKGVEIVAFLRRGERERERERESNRLGTFSLHSLLFILFTAHPAQTIMR